MGSSKSKVQQKGRNQHPGSDLQPSTHHPAAAYRDTEPRIVLGNQSAYRVSFWVLEEYTKHDKNKRKERQEQLVDSMVRHLNHGHLGEGAPSPERIGRALEEPTEAPTAGVSGPNAETVGREDDRAKEDECSRKDGGGRKGDCYKQDEKKREGDRAREEEDDGMRFLTRDHRMEPREGTQHTRVPFPVDCRELRVFAFFESGGGDRWLLFLDKAYSLGLFKKVFTFIASNVDISPPRITDPERR